MFKDIDLVIIGAGLSGCVIAEQVANILDWEYIENQQEIN